MSEARELLAQGYHYATMYGSEEAVREPDFEPSLEEEAALWAITTARRQAIEECARVAEGYPSPLDDLPMAMAVRGISTAIRALLKDTPDAP